MNEISDRALADEIGDLALAQLLGLQRHIALESVFHSVADAWHWACERRVVRGQQARPALQDAYDRCFDEWIRRAA